MDTFNLNNEVLPEHFLQDRIALNIEGFFLSGDINELSEAFRFLACAPRSSPTDQYCGWIYNRRGGRPLPTEFHVRSGNHTTAGATPLFHGRLKLTNRDHGNSNYTSQLKLKLSINPTRFIAHQIRPDNYEQSNSQWDFTLRKEGVGRIPDGLPFRARERSLDRNDNLLLFSDWEYYALENWEDNLRRYISGIVDCHREELQRCCTLAGSIEGIDLGLLNDHLEFQLNDTENFIDFATPHGIPAVEFVSQLSPLLTSYRSHRIDQYDNSHDSSTNENYSKSHALHLANGIDLKVYAKTTRRVRFEVTYKLKSCPALIRETGDRRRALSTNNLAELILWLDRLRVDSSARLNALFAFLRRRYDFSGQSYAAYLLPLRVAEILGRTSYVSAIVSSLVESGSVSFSNGDPIRRHIIRLVEAGILERSEPDGRRCRTFTLTPPYQSGREYLHSDQNRRIRRRRMRDGE